MTDSQSGTKSHSSVAGSLLLPMLVVLGAGACNKPDAPTVEVYQAHQFLADGKQDKDLGADCGKQGPSACRSNLCIHTQAGSGDGWVCSKRCETDEDCPSSPVQWRCVQIFPAAGNEVCLPPGPAPLGQPSGNPSAQ